MGYRKHHPLIFRGYEMAKVKKSPKKFSGLALSGGGFRATLFHLGVLWRMNELAHLGNLNRITSVSGGSILAGHLGCIWRDLDFVNGVAGNFPDLVAEPIKQFCSRTVDGWAIAKGKLDPFNTAADYVTSAYNKHLYHGATLHDLPDDMAGEGPRFIIYATNLQSGVSFRFSRPYMADYRIGLNRNTGDVLVADAVAASSAFPPILTPKVLETDPDNWEQDTDPKKRGDLWKNEDFRRKIYLSDGGVYDNMGLEAVFDQCNPLFVSAAGGPFSSEPLGWKEKHSEIGIGLRATSILTEQTRALRRRMVIRGYQDKERGGAYWNIASEISAYKLKDPIIPDNDLTKSLRFVRTRLNSFSPEEQGQLINWGYAIADAAIRKWVSPQKLGDWEWPSPEYPL
jgi:NTE family protein